MKSEGVDVRPLITIDQPESPNHEINMVYLQDVKVPKENLVGTQGEGWTCAKYLLEFERGNAYSPGLAAAMPICVTSPRARKMVTVLRSGKTSVSAAGSWLWRLRSWPWRPRSCILSALAAGQNVGPRVPC